jgi:hypothetical protein
MNCPAYSVPCSRGCVARGSLGKAGSGDSCFVLRMGWRRVVKERACNVVFWVVMRIWESGVVRRREKVYVKSGRMGDVDNREWKNVFVSGEVV